MKVLKSSVKLSLLAVIVAVLISHNLYAASAASGGRMGGSSFSSGSSPSSRRHDYHHHHSSSVYGLYDSHPRFSMNANQGNGSKSAAGAYVMLTIFMGAASYLVYLNFVEGGTSILQIQFTAKPLKLVIVFALFLCFMYVSYASSSSGAMGSNYDSGEGSESAIVCDVEPIILILLWVSFGVVTGVTLLHCIFKGGDTFLMLQPSGISSGSDLWEYWIYTSKVSSPFIQVGLSAKARSLQRELTEIATTTDTSTANGWQLILEETTSSLLRHPDYYLYGYSFVTRCWTIGGAEQHFKRLSKEERQKFDVESLVNINNFKRTRAVAPKADKVNKDCIVVTVLVAVQGAHNLPTIRTTDDVKEALQSLGEICSSKTKGVEILWTPQDETDSLSVEELLENYPQLRRI
ncbi:hypothetical protein SCA6_016248 [Theobroma cacao]